MRVIVYDCTDRPDLGYRSPTLRIVDQDGTLILQGVVLCEAGRELAERIAAGLGVLCEWIGPPAKAVVRPAAALPAAPPATLDPPVSYEVAPKSRNQLALFS